MSFQDCSSSFHTQRKPGSPFTFTVQADSHMDQGTQPTIYERTLANMSADRPDLFIDLGDTFMTDKYDNFKDSLPQYIASQQPVWLAIATGSWPKSSRKRSMPRRVSSRVDV